MAGADRSVTLAVEAVDIAFAQSSITIPANTDVSFTLTNSGVVNHDFRIDEPAGYFSMLEGGPSATFVVTVPAGAYEYYCTVPGHREAGMAGMLNAQ